ncbi:hypothetical protein BH11PLA2_BH11PLA2_50470 [soil metagenome]
MIRIALSVLLCFANLTSADDRSAITEGVATIACPGSPGPLCVFGTNAFPVVIVDNDVIIAAGTLGQGKVVAFGHNGYFEDENLKVGDTKKLLLNAIRWAGGKEATVVVHGMPGLAKSLKAEVVTVINKLTAKNTVLIVGADSITDDQVAPYIAFIKAGGSIITGTPGWGWRQTHKDKTLDKDFPANRVFAAVGITWADHTITKPKEGTISVKPPLKLTHTGEAITGLEAWLQGGAAPLASDAEAMRVALTRIEGSVPPDLAAPMQTRLATAIAKSKDKIPTPTAKKPLKQADAAGRLLFGLSTQIAMKLPAEQLTAHPAAAAFPGSVPVDAQRILKTISFDITSKGYICNGVGVSDKSAIWQSTGLYAAPGELITVTVPEALANKKLGVRIGCHTDKLGDLKSWQRAPEISTHITITSAVTKLANPFGGLVYITAPPGVELGKIDVSVAGAVEATTFVLGVTTPQQWQEQKKHAAPWAEFVSKKIVITVPVDKARMVEDPAELLEFWNKVMDADADLTQVSRERGRAERLVHDVQISAGYMHSGYPIMCPLGEVPRVISVATIQRDGAWGYFHELGHNHQQRDWTPEGTVEVTCNLYCNRSPRGT